ncbi:hypothetical protein RIF29_33965 [Crotalaria pallida]|uniref:LOB domain-containing protein n=1 Tax=Crotalaria pallida TaxID=3830 RepID=A0AAN9E8X1_CROPI
MSSSNSPCAACKFLRRKCTQECPFAPYFPPDNPQRFSCVHRVFGASNVAKLLNELSPSQREDAVKSLAYEAEARLRDPVYGCIGFISVLQHRLRQIQSNVHNAKKELSAYLGPQGMQALQVMLENPNIFPQNNGMNVMPLQQHGAGNPFPNVGFPSYGNNNNMMAMASSPPLLVATPQNHLAVGDAQRQELLEAQQLAATQEFVRLSGTGFEGIGGGGGGDGGGGGGGGGFNQMGGGGGDGGPELALGNFDNVSFYQIQQQQQGEPHPNPNHVPHHHYHHQQHQHPVEEQFLLLPQQTQPSQMQPQSEGGDRNSVGPS